MALEGIALKSTLHTPSLRKMGFDGSMKSAVITLNSVARSGYADLSILGEIVNHS